jgi:hypothetical protein
MRADLAHHPDDGPIPRPNTSLARIVIEAGLLFCLALITPALALLVKCAG